MWRVQKGSSKVKKRSVKGTETAFFTADSTGETAVKSGLCESVLRAERGGVTALAKPFVRRMQQSILALKILLFIVPSGSETLYCDCSLSL